MMLVQATSESLRSCSDDFPQRQISLRQKGAALIIVLGLIVLLSTIAAGHARNVHSEIRLAMLHYQSAKARTLAEAGIQLAIYSLLQRSNDNRWSVNGTINRLDFGGSEVNVALRDATGLVDLNFADASLLQVLFSVAVDDIQQQEKLVGALLDWRDPDDLTRLNGAEDDDYRTAGFPWTAHDGAFSSIEELRYLIGMTPQKFAAIAPYVTIYSGQATLNLEYAPLELISILDSPRLAGFVSVGNKPSSNYKLEGRAGSRNGTYHIYAGASGTADIFVTIEAVVNISASSDKPYTILNWREPARFNFFIGRD